MDKMWAGRFEKALDKMADDFNSSIHFDKKMYKQDIKGSLEHASMLCAVGILTPAELDSITEGLVSILDDLNNGSLQFDLDAEDIHMFVEAELTKRIGRRCCRSCCCKGFFRRRYCGQCSASRYYC